LVDDPSHQNNAINMKLILKSTSIILLAIAFSSATAHAAKPGAGNKNNNAAKKDPVAEYLKAHDKNKDGAIQKSEFVTGSKSEFDKYDANKDGKLDKSELASLLNKGKK